MDGGHPCDQRHHGGQRQYRGRGVQLKDLLEHQPENHQLHAHPK